MGTRQCSCTGCKKYEHGSLENLYSQTQHYVYVKEKSTLSITSPCSMTFEEEPSFISKYEA